MNTSLADWNECLVQAVFRGHPDVLPEILRIDATDRFLAYASGNTDASLARRSFLAAMPKTPEGVRRLFDASALGSWSPSHPSLPFYAQLHLTIMAASADEELHGEGDFRRRLAQMLGLPIVDYLQGRHLPQLWEKARRWSERRAEKGDAVRRLVLPDPGNQTIIGYSKRLAFPGFLDQNQLADFLGEEDMDADAPTTRLLSSLRACKHRFSERFQMEFDSWAACWESGDSENALHTPFWAAMLETTWRREQEPAHGRAHGCTLEIDPMEPRDLAVWLYGPSTVRGVSAWRLDENDRLNDGRVRWRHSRDGRPGALLDIVKERARRDAPTLGRFGKTLMQGVLIFGQDEEGRWFDVPVFPASGTIWLILNDAYSSLLGAPRGSAQGEPVQRARLQGSEDWHVLGPLASGEQLREWFAQRTFGLDIFEPRLRRPRIHVIETPRGDDGVYLWLPPMVPAFRCEGAHAGSVMVDGDRSAVPRDLKFEDDGRLTLPSDMWSPPKGNRTLRIAIQGRTGQLLASTSFHFRDESQALCFKMVRDPNKWLESGIDGRLAAYEPDWLQRDDSDSHPSVDVAQSISGPSSVLDRERSHTSKVIVTEADAIDERWWRTLEILTAVFARRSAWPLETCFETLHAIWGTKPEAWARLDDLIENALVRVLHARHWSSRVVVPIHPFVIQATADDRIEFRLCGTTSSAMRSLVSAVLGAGCRVFAPKGHDLAGACVWHTTAPDAAMALAEQTGWRVLERKDICVPRMPTVSESLANSIREDISGHVPRKKSTWSMTGRFFRPAAGERILPRLERWCSDGQQDLYVLFRSNGGLWNTDCRHGALRALQVESGLRLATVSEDGSVNLDASHLSLPSPIARANIAIGGGVCYRNSDGKRVYPGGECGSIASACTEWMSTARDTELQSRVLERLRSHYSHGLERRRLDHRWASMGGCIDV